MHINVSCSHHVKSLDQASYQDPQINASEVLFGSRKCYLVFSQGHHLDHHDVSNCAPDILSVCLQCNMEDQ